MKYNIKNILFRAIICMIFISFISCDSFLDESSTTVTNENTGGGGKDNATQYTTATQMEQLLAGAYSDYANEFWQLDWYIMNDAQSDNAYAGEPKEMTMQFDELRVSASNGGVKRDWGYLYSQISKANTIIEWIPKIKDTALTEQRRGQIAGDAHFMRALCYFNLVRIYGSVPLITQYVPEISISNIDTIYPLLYPKQETVENIYTQIVNDLEYAEANVMDYSANKFKITKALVHLIQAQVYATKDGFENTDWNKVKQYAKAVVDDTRYGLMDNYDDLFAVAETPSNGVLPSVNLVNEHCKESIFEVDYNSWSTLGNWGAQMFYGIDWKKFNTPSQDLYKAFTSAGDVVRRDASIMFGDVTGKWTDKYWPSNKYPYCYKLRSQEAGNIVIFRLPEAILLLAEAENELGNIGEAKNLVNKIRKRVDLADTQANTKDAMRLAIENENRFEFAFEGKRWMDLKRRGRFIQVMRSASDHQNAYASRLNENKLVWPIPQSELDLNVNLVQNPGY